METFNLYKSRYIAAKHTYLNAITRHLRSLYSDDYPNGEAEKQVVSARAKRARAAAYGSLINAATLMVGYIAHSLYGKCDDRGFCVLVEGYPVIEEADLPTFKFGFNYAVSYPLENYDFRSPELHALFQQVQFGYVKVEEAVDLLKRAQIPVAEVDGLCDLSDDEVMEHGMITIFDQIECALIEQYERLYGYKP